LTRTTFERKIFPDIEARSWRWDETLRIKSLLGFVNGQTTNPSLIAKNPQIQQLIASGHTLTAEEEKNEYRQHLSPLFRAL
jgi:transaldolase